MSVPLDKLQSDNQRSRQHCAEARLLFAVKNAKYEGAFHESGVVGCVAEIRGITKRLKAMTINQPDHGRSVKQELAELLADLHNYANMTLLCLEENNWEGVDDD